MYASYDKLHLKTKYIHPRIKAPPRFYKQATSAQRNFNKHCIALERYYKQ